MTLLSSAGPILTNTVTFAGSADMPVYARHMANAIWVYADQFE